MMTEMHPAEGFEEKIRYDFRNPFRYTPSESVIAAARKVISHIDSDTALKTAFGQGKMLGVLTVEDDGGRKGFLAAYSGRADGVSCDGYFVPPVYDTETPDGYFKAREAEISAINERIRDIENSAGYVSASENLHETIMRDRKETEDFAVMCSSKKAERKLRRETWISPMEKEAMDRESMFLKAEMKRRKAAAAAREAEAMAIMTPFLEEIRSLKNLRQSMSEKLQDWLFSQYTVSNALGERRTIKDIFKAKGLVPPGGTGECAAPKLLQFAYLHGLKPLSMGEFWYGRSPAEEIRSSGRFYPSCSRKCGPLLEFMMQGLEISDTDGVYGKIRLIFKGQELCAVYKPAGIPSVPGKDGRKSLTEYLSDGECEGCAKGSYYPVHRLDMDTKGIMLFATTPAMQKAMQEMFASRSVKKTYIATLGCRTSAASHRKGEKGLISIPLAPDPDDRPRQKADFDNGKPTETLYEIIDTDENGGMLVKFSPFTGRTHQLRVHSAHPKGLGTPISGDLLYGGEENPDGLQLTATGIEFTHPFTGEHMHFTIEAASTGESLSDQ